MEKKKRKPAYKIPCPDPLKGERCRVCGGKYVCLQPERKKLSPTPPADKGVGDQ